MGLLKDWMARWRFRLPERPAAEPGSVFITMDEKNTPVDVRTDDTTKSRKTKRGTLQKRYV